MSAEPDDYFALPDGRKVGWGLTNRNGNWRIWFAGPDGKRVE